VRPENAYGPAADAANKALPPDAEGTHSLNTGGVNTPPKDPECTWAARDVCAGTQLAQTPTSLPRGPRAPLESGLERSVDFVATGGGVRVVATDL
jgi:hypothetical protein